MNTNIYIVKGWGYEWFLRYQTFNEVGWVGTPLGSSVSVRLDLSYHKEHQGI